MQFRTNRRTRRPFIVTVVERPFSRGSMKYGPVTGESRYNRKTGEMEIVGKERTPVINEHELGHLMLARFADEHTTRELEDVLRPLMREFDHRSFFYENSYYRDNLDEAIAETFAARKFGWKNTDLGFDPEVITPKIWAFVNVIAEMFE